MINKIFIVFFLTFSLLHASKYPNLYKKLSNPLYDSMDVVVELSNIKELNKSSLDYMKYSKDTLKYGYEIDDNYNTKNAKAYLDKLRKLQKKYDYIVHLVNEKINNSIDINDYDSFFSLTSCNLDGILKRSDLLNKSLEFYKNNSKNKKIKFLDSTIEIEKITQYNDRDISIKPTKAIFNINKENSKALKKNNVYIYSEVIDNKVLVYVKNTNFYVVSVKIKQNKNKSTTFVLNPNSKKEYARYDIRNIKHLTNYSYSWIAGSVDAIHNNEFVYRLPFRRGLSCLVSQGYGGRTHKGGHKYSIDFVMDIGTKIYAARKGRVIQVKSDSNRGGNTKDFLNDGNYILIQHDDDTLAMYGHLKKDGVSVVVGQRIAKGQDIGYSGNTGFSSGPHLHFSVYKVSNNLTDASLPIKFSSTNGVIDNPKVTAYYTAN